MRITFERLINSGLFLASLFLTSCGGGGGQSSPPVPAVPAGLVATAKDSYVLLNVSSVAGATGYNIYWSTASGVTPTSGTKLPVTSVPLAHTGLTNGQTYYYVSTAVNRGGESAASSAVSATPQAVVANSDPLFGDQWHLLNTGLQLGANSLPGKQGEDINVQPAWAVTKGKGVRIAIVDDGLEMAHEDLASNVAANGQSYNYVTLSSDPTNDPADLASGHGTAVAGIAAARDLNNLGGSSVAPRATLVGYNFLQNSSASNEVDALTRNAVNVSVSSNSWGNPDGTGNLAPSSATWQSAINTGLTNGRGGRGTVYVWAAGNGATGNAMCPACVDNSNYDGNANYRGVMAVAAVNDQGVQASYSESGANLWVSAPGGVFCNTHTITTTDRTGAAGKNPPDPNAGYSDYLDTKYTRCMNGTSAATPEISGVVALMLAANPSLGWRDVRIILAQSARKNDATDPGWASTGGAPIYHYNHRYGFGVVDAGAAVTAAKNWGVVASPEKIFSTPLTNVATKIPDNNSTGISSFITVTNSGIASIEYVGITFNAADHTYAGDLDITLTSPTGTVSQLAVLHYCEMSRCTPYNGWVFGSARHLGESANGTWKLTVKDMRAVDTGTFQSWQLKFYGH